MPPSPLLFALSLEPFLCHVRLNPDVTGVSVGNLQQKVSAYADDMMFTLTKPIISLPNLLREFEIYRALSNLKISFTKSEAMGVDTPQPQLQLRATFKLKWTDTAFKYLGTTIPSKLSKIFNLISPLLKSPQ